MIIEIILTSALIIYVGIDKYFSYLDRKHIYKERERFFMMTKAKDLPEYTQSKIAEMGQTQEEGGIIDMTDRM